jgi:hypothetical protein
MKECQNQPMINQCLLPICLIHSNTWKTMKADPLWIFQEIVEPTAGRPQKEHQNEDCLIGLSTRGHFFN